MKNTIFTLLCLGAIIFTTASAQPVIKKQWGAGSNGADNFTSMYPTSDKGWIVGGSSNGNSSCQKNGNNRDNTGATNDYWVIKYNNSGTIQWERTIGGNKDEQFVALQQTYDGGYILGGYSYSGKSGEKTQNSRGENDYWIVKLDNAGTIQWSKTIGGNSFEQLYSIQQTLDSGYVLGGYSVSGISGEKTIAATGYWIVKLDKTGKIQWDKVVDVSGELQQTKDGGYVIGGGVYLTKLDDKANVLWSKIVAHASADVDGDGDYDGSLSYVVQTDDGGYTLGGRIRATPDLDGYYFWIVKADSLGNKQWSRQYGVVFLNV